MRGNIYINFNGNCREALDYYSGIFGVEPVEVMNFGEMPPSDDFQIPEEARNLVLFSRLIIGDLELLMSDTLPGLGVKIGNNMSIVIESDSIDQLRDLFRRLKHGGVVQMDMGESFFSKYYGMVTDKFGINWQLSHRE